MHQVREVRGRLPPPVRSPGAAFGCAAGTCSYNALKRELRTGTGEGARSRERLYAESAVDEIDGSRS